MLEECVLLLLHTNYVFITSSLNITQQAKNMYIKSDQYISPYSYRSVQKSSLVLIWCVKIIQFIGV